MDLLMRHPTTTSSNGIKGILVFIRYRAAVARCHIVSIATLDNHIYKCDAHEDRQSEYICTNCISVTVAFNIGPMEAREQKRIYPTVQ